MDVKEVDVKAKSYENDNGTTVYIVDNKKSKNNNNHEEEDSKDNKDNVVSFDDGSPIPKEKQDLLLSQPDIKIKMKSRKASVIRFVNNKRALFGKKLTKITVEFVPWSEDGNGDNFSFNITLKQLGGVWVEKKVNVSGAEGSHIIKTDKPGNGRYEIDGVIIDVEWVINLIEGNINEMIADRNEGKDPYKLHEELLDKLGPNYQEEYEVLVEESEAKAAHNEQFPLNNVVPIVQNVRPYNKIIHVPDEMKKQGKGKGNRQDDFDDPR